MDNKKLTGYIAGGDHKTVASTEKPLMLGKLK